MPRGAEWPLQGVHILNNLLLRNTTSGEGGAHGSDLTLYMGCQGDSFTRTVPGNSSDYNLFANTAWAPTMRHTWNPDNTFAQWQERFGEDRHSRLAPIACELRGTAFRLLTRDGLDGAAPLPPELRWTPTTPGRIGSSLTQWP